MTSGPYLMSMTTRPMTFADRFAGTDKINELHRIVGAIVTNLGGVEETLRFLEWNLMAFDLAANMQGVLTTSDVYRALEPEKNRYFVRHKLLFRILEGIGNGIDKASVQNALGDEAANIVSQWQSLKAAAQDLGDRRNAIAHVAIGLTGASLVRGQGFVMPSQPVQPGEDEQLLKEIGDFGRKLMSFVSDLGARLPFKDNTTIHAAKVTVRL